VGVFEFEYGTAWKQYDFDTMVRLHEKGYIRDPHNKRKSVDLTPDGLVLAKLLAEKLFATKSQSLGGRRIRISESKDDSWHSRKSKPNNASVTFRGF